MSSLLNFNSFSRRPARNYRNPRTQEVIKSPAKNVLRFKPSKKATSEVQNYTQGK